jgi:hypothetical protein
MHGKLLKKKKAFPMLQGGFEQIIRILFNDGLFRGISNVHGKIFLLPWIIQ